MAENKKQFISIAISYIRIFIKPEETFFFYIYQNNTRNILPHTLHYSTTEKKFPFSLL